MNPSFSSYLVNEPFGDPGLYVEIRWARRALLFDLGENQALSPTRLLRAGDLFVSHTHMDHFIGFDRVLRVALGRGKTLRLFGPPGLIANVAGKLRGYTWNLVDGYPLTLEVREFHPREIRSATFRAGEGFLPQEAPPCVTPDGLSEAPFPVLEDPMFTVRAIALNHRIPSFAYALQEQFHINVNKERLRAAGLPVGSWLKDLKQHLWQGQPDDFRFTATLYLEHRREEREFVLGDVRDRFVTITRGQKLAYVVDVRYDEDNEAKIVALARDADVFYCEAPYLDCDADKARERYHLTARQAGRLANRAGVRQLVVFHFSPRYTGQGDAIVREAQSAFEGG
ncbi:MAG: ribonuclease Z [Nitrospirae bacterium]|nr:MAG: ribonuclease Z [Nitrospirota bacterium]